MPFINVKTNVNVSKRKAKIIKRAMGTAITAIPGKSEDLLMVSIEGDHALWFKGTGEPAAMVEVQIYGKAPNHYEKSGPSSSVSISIYGDNDPVKKISELTSRISDILSDELEISPDRIYVSYMYTQHWGWNGNNF